MFSLPVRFIALAFLFFLPLAANAQEATPKPLRILFVGNSYTYENNLPFVFETLARPLRSVKVTMLARGGATLRQHIDRDDILTKIIGHQFDVLVLQEQSTLGATCTFDGLAPIRDPAAFHKAVREFARAARVGNTRLVLFATWPRAETPHSLAALHNANVTIGREVNAAVAPVGLVWDRLGGDSCEALHLYGPDGAHPSGEGTYVAAVVLIRTILGKTPPLTAISKVPLMDGLAHLSGSFADIALTPQGGIAIQQAVDAIYRAASGERFPTLSVVPPVSAPALPPYLVRGRLSTSFLQGQWEGEFATFGLSEKAKLTLDLRTEPAKIRMIHTTEGWPGADDVTAKSHEPDADGVLTLTYRSKEKDCMVEIKLVRVGTQLRGLVRYIGEGGQEWLRSTLTLARRQR